MAKRRDVVRDRAIALPDAYVDVATDASQASGYASMTRLLVL